ncbi:MAG: acetyl-CoA C-acyltransferase [Zetaproteobacteria bacterium]|nr:acetyl-CoA C-acyltransferase [Pseudobdellovibrionaceae bacterium]|tara:strand:- start:172 stop:1356 length:1185 start_codon:yes stop_codon:yes gene_type:complete
MSDFSVIVYAKRTAIGKFNGSFSEVSAPMLSASLVKDALMTSKLKSSLVDELIMGQVLTAGCGQAPARQAAIYGGLDNSVPCTTVNKVCGSGLKAVILADQAIRAKDAQVIFAGGQENMSRSPHLLLNSRAGLGFGNKELVDHMQIDGLWDPYENVGMGYCGELCAKEYDFTREQQDEYTRISYERAQKSWEKERFVKEVIPIQAKHGKNYTFVEKDEEPFRVKFDKIASLKPAFKKDGTITAANASSISDGAALLMLMSAKKAKELSLKPLARVIASQSFAHEPSWFTTAPVEGIIECIKKSSLTLKDISLFEINEAFSVVPMHAIKALSLSHKFVNPMGGAISLGHPIGCSGARILVTLLNALNLQKERFGCASICIGGGESNTMILENLRL